MHLPTVGVSSTVSETERFFAKVQHDPLTGCWNWTAAQDKDGYGHFWLCGKVVGAHRWAFTFYIGEPGNLLVCHQCDNPSCVNPGHLFLGDRLDNCADMVTKSRHTHGENHSSAKITEADVTTIRNNYRNGTTTKSICEQFNLSVGHVRKIVSHRFWKHV